MKFFTQILQFIQQIPEKNMQRYMYMVIGGMGIVVSGVIFLVHNKSTDLVEQFRKIEKLSRDAVPLFQDYEKIQRDEKRIQDQLEKYQGEDIKSFFELFCKNLGVTPQPGWDANPADINQKFEEITVKATFKGQTTQKLVEILDAIQKEAISKNKILYTKNVDIKHDQSKNQIAFDLTIATVRMKKEG